jgi:NUMOD4 motif
MTHENWKDIPGYEGRYQVSDLGRVLSLPFLQRYLLRTGVAAYRRTSRRVLATNLQNSGYLLVHLNLDGVRRAMLVHRLVAVAFVSNPLALPEVNHLNSCRTDCRAVNLEWTTSSGNKQHCVTAGRNSQAYAVLAPSGKTYSSLQRAMRGERVGRRTARKWVASCG